MDEYGAFLKRGYPKMDGLSGKILLKWMMTGGTPIYGNLHMLSIKHTVRVSYPNGNFKAKLR